MSGFESIMRNLGPVSSKPPPMAPKFMDAIKEGIDFINSQIALYTDACAGFLKILA